MIDNIAVIGAGCVGCAVAPKLKRVFPNAEVTVLEKHDHEFAETSHFNSGVIHSGIHQNPNFLKSELAQKGSRMLVEFCEVHDVPHRRSGMVIAVASEDIFGLVSEVRSLYLLWLNSRRQHIPLKVLTSRGVRKLEPEVEALGGIYIPDIWVVDQLALGKTMRKVAEREGVRFEFNSEVMSITRVSDRYVIRTRGGASYEASLVVNASGVNADLVATYVSVNRYRTYPCRGEYYEVVGDKRSLIRSTLIYPALPPTHPVKGVHLTKTVDGRLLIGPNASKWLTRDDNWSVHTPPDEFVRGARKFLPGLEIKDVRWAYSGLRAKVNEGRGEDDFVISMDARDPYFVNLIGIESPGLTSSLAIGEYVTNMVAEAAG